MVKQELTYQQRYYKKNKAKLKAYQKEYRENNSVTKHKMADYREENKDIIKAKAKEYYLKHKFD